VWSVRRYSRNSWRNFFELGLGQIGILAVGLTSTTLWARFAGKDLYGNYQLVYSYIAIVSSFSLAGLGESAAISSAKGYDGNLIQATNYKISTDLIGSLILVGLGFHFFQGNHLLGTGLFVAALFYPFIFLQNLWVPWLNNKGKLQLLPRLQLLESVVSLAVLGALVIGHCRNLFIYLAAIMIETSLFNGCVLLWLYETRENSRLDWDTIKYGFHISAIGLLGWLGAIDKPLIDKNLSAAAVAVYSIAQVFPLQMKYLFTIFNKLFAPGIYGAHSVTQAWFYLRPRMLPVMALFTSIGLIGFFALPIVIPILFSKAYVESIPYARWMWLWWGLTSPLGFLYVALVAQKKRNYILIHSVVYPIVLAVMFWSLIHRFGLWGAIEANIITGALAGLYHVLAFSFYLRQERGILI